MKIQINIYIITVFFIFSGFYISRLNLFAQECSTRLSAYECEEKKKELKNIEKLLDENKVILEIQNQEARSIKRDISIIQNEIYREQLSIRARNIEIQGLTGDIQDSDQKLTELNNVFNTHNNILQKVLQEMNTDENRTFLQIFFTKQSLSSFFQKIRAHKEYNFLLQKSIEKLKHINIKITKQQEILIAKRHEILFLKDIQQKRATEIEVKKEKQEEILNLVQETQDAYEQIINKQEETAAQIRSQIFNLLGTKSITVPEAIDLAKYAERIIGVDAAFILAIVEQETSLGKNLGNGLWRKDMHPTRDRSIFLALTRILGVDPDTVPVSKKLSYGWGGAMGPAQFIPSTWSCFGGFTHNKTNKCNYNKNIKNFWSGPWSYSAKNDQIRQVTGNKFPSSPWNPQDSFVAAALLLKDLGATRNVYGAKWCAALKYYSGSCSKKNQSRYSFYPDTVEKREIKFNRYIQKL